MTKASVNERLAVIDEKIDNMLRTQGEVLENVKKTNGRVNVIEDKQIEHETEVRLVKAGVKLLAIPVLLMVVKWMFDTFLP